VAKLKFKFIQSFCKGFLAAALLSSATFANAVIIESELTSLGGNSFQYDFNVINDDLVDGLEGFTVNFDWDLYSNLALVSSAPLWDTFVVEPVVNVNLGFFDSYFDAATPIALNDSLGGFAISFDWLGTASGPSAAGNPFEIYKDPFNNFEIVAFGNTTEPVVIQPPNPIPEPGLLSLFGLALLFVGSRKRVS